MYRVPSPAPVAAALALTLLLAACGTPGNAGPAPAPTPAPTPPAATATAEPAPVQPAATTAADPAPAPAPVPSLLAALTAAKWRFAAAPVAQALPPPEGRYQSPQENPNYIEHAYAGGALRLYTDPQAEQVFALLADSADPAFAGYAALATTEGYTVAKVGAYAIVTRALPIDNATFTALAAGTWSVEQLRQRLGEPSYMAHLHGIGDFLYVYVPEQLTFAGGQTYRLIDPKRPPWDNPAPTPALPTYDDYRNQFTVGLVAFARGLGSTRQNIVATLAAGKPSPGGQYRAADWGRGGYWDNWILIQRPGKSEVRQRAHYFIQSFDWLDDHRVVYAEVSPIGDTVPFYAVDAVTGEQSVIAQVKAQVDSFGVAAPGKLWYKTADGVRHELSAGG